jgi:hypothetical protein
MPGDIPKLALLCVVASALLGAVSWILFRGRRDPRDGERKRRAQVHLRGRMGDASITDFRDGVVYYSYEIRGVAYTASQDLSGLAGGVPPEPACLIGHANMKYHPRNPANSIVLCEEWSGLRIQSPKEKQAS